MLKKLIRINLDDVALFCGVEGGLFLLVHLITAGILIFTKSDVSFMLAGIILPIAAGFLALIATVGHVGVTFPMALKFGQTRRRALGLTLGIVGFEALVSAGLAALLTRLERLIAPHLWRLMVGAQYVTVSSEGQSTPEYMAGIQTVAGQPLSVLDVSLSWRWFLVIALGCAVVGLIVGAILQRFGRKGFWGLWVIWMVACFSPQLLPWKQYTITNWLFPLIGVVIIAGLIWSVWSLLHTVVKA